MTNTTTVTILQIDDTHGYLEPHPELFWQGDKAEYRPAGGYARLLTIFKLVRRERNGAVIALDNGDTFPWHVSRRSFRRRSVRRTGEPAGP